MTKFDKNQKTVIILVILLIIVTVIIYKFTRIDNTEDKFSENYDILKNETSTKEENTEVVNKETIIIHVTGCVTRQGIVKLKEGDRISDAIESAGGITGEADMSRINLAYELEDGQKIYIPSINDKKVSDEDEILKKEYITDEPGDAIIVENNEETAVKKKEENTVININTAEQSELEQIPGVGSSTALKIIEYRKTNGKFKTIEDIKNVKGIGDAKFETMKNNICVK